MEFKLKETCEAFIAARKANLSEIEVEIFQTVLSRNIVVREITPYTIPCYNGDIWGYENKIGVRLVYLYDESEGLPSHVNYPQKPQEQGICVIVTPYDELSVPANQLSRAYYNLFIDNCEFQNLEQ